VARLNVNKTRLILKLEAGIGKELVFVAVQELRLRTNGLSLGQVLNVLDGCGFGVFPAGDAPNFSVGGALYVKKDWCRGPKCC
jgi:hypothetical protein